MMRQTAHHYKNYRKILKLKYFANQKISCNFAFSKPEKFIVEHY